MPTTENTKHPAKYTDSLIPVFARMLNGNERVLDPFGGTGKIFSLLNVHPNLAISAVEIEPEWARLDTRMVCGDALKLPFQDNIFDVCLTSPTYGNRLADKFLDDGTRRMTYANALGRNVSPNSSGSLQWGSNYKTFHLKAWDEVRRVTKNGGFLILNMKNHIRNGVEQRVTEWHIRELREIGFSVIDLVRVSTPSMRFGQNGNTRIEYESVIKFILRK